MGGLSAPQALTLPDLRDTPGEEGALVEASLTAVSGALLRED